MYENFTFPLFRADANQYFTTLPFPVIYINVSRDSTLRTNVNGENCTRKFYLVDKLNSLNIGYFKFFIFSERDHYDFNILGDSSHRRFEKYCISEIINIGL